jgi:trk system potassium uptake protein TrkA
LKFGFTPEANMYVIIVGCGRVGSELAKLLSNEGHNIVIIDRDPTSFDRLGQAFNGLTMVGNGGCLLRRDQR